MDDESKIIGSHKDRKNLVIFFLIVLVVVFAGLSLWFSGVMRENKSGQSSTATTSYVVVGNNTKSNVNITVEQSIPKIGVITQTFVPVENMANYEIDVTAVGFSPGSITVSKGQSVVWTIRDNGSHWIEANPSDPYPEKGTCGSSFDSCVALSLGQSFRMVFNDAGTWTYYDKLNPQFTGTVIVK